MKSLVDFIRENEMKIKESQEAADSKKSFNFAFNGLDNAKETIESLNKMAEDKGIDHESTEESFTITLTRDLCQNDRDKIEGIQDVLQQYSDMIRKDSSNASDESHAQKTAKFEKTVDDMVKFIDNANEEPDDEENDKKDDKNDDEE